ncbi:MAG: GntR family transcriptional regulator [Boseongicola sp. SB0673_bin_14]|nr:GntR family transcriptional regulator [Boseongicola sp. SB0667_bin_21]MYI68263.1 GntR family transcriptional regulator [Boseongicola sp. SB0673_bin_14]
MQQLGRMTASRCALEGRLASSGPGPGDRLPPERDLSGRLKISRGKLRKALTALEAEGIVERHAGVARSCVCRRPPTGTTNRLSCASPRSPAPVPQ